MPMFISGRVAVTAAGVIDEKDITPQTDVIFIRPRMDYGTRQRVLGAGTKLALQQARRKGKAKAPDVDLDVGAYQIALLRYNILAWQGPSFVGVACTPAHIEQLNPDEQLVQRVLAEIAERNAPAGTRVESEGEDAAEDDDPNVVPGLVVAASTSAGD